MGKERKRMRETLTMIVTLTCCVFVDLPFLSYLKEQPSGRHDEVIVQLLCYVIIMLY